MPDSSFVDVVGEIKDRLNILDIISPHVNLKKMGRNFKGLCPFHSEKTPSFVVFPDKGNYHCFGCGANGDVFGFLMKTQGMSFGEALKVLAQRAGISLPERRPDVEAEDRKRTRLREINSAAAQYYHHLLLRSEAGKIARDYLQRRGLNAQTVEVFQLGYSLDSWNALEKHLSGRGYGMEELIEAGLLVEREGGEHYDRFRNRLVFPIRDARGNVTGFGARALDDSNPKYLNSPQTPLFDKGASLYGLDAASSAIREADRAVVVEGYVDVLISHQCGIKNVVAALGTALTERQVATLKKYTKNLVLALDPDAAGDEATLRGLEVAKQVFDKKAVPVPTWRGLIRYEYKLDADIRIITLPRGKDPDEVIREDAERWRTLIERAVPIVDYYFNIVTSQLDLSQAKNKSAAVERLLPIIKELRDKVEQAHYLQKLAHLAQVSERSLEVSLSRVRLAGPSQGHPRAEEVQQAKGGAARAHISLEEYLLALLLSYPEVIGRVADLESEELGDARTRQLAVALKAYLATGEPFDFERFRETIDPVLHDFLDNLSEWARMQPPMADNDVNREIDGCLMELRRRNLREHKRQLAYLMRDAEQAKDWEGVRHFTQRFEELRAKLALYEREGSKAWVWK